MTRHTLLSLLFAWMTLVFGPSLHAVTITSISPASGPTEGGTAVTIHGTDFADCAICSPPFPVRVYFDGIPAVAVLVDANTIEAISPPHPPGEASVWVQQYDGYATNGRAFTYTGDVPDDAFERILLPVLTPPVSGSFSSLFFTDLRIEHKQQSGGDEVLVFGLTSLPVCNFDPCIGEYNPSVIAPDYPLDSSQIVFDGTPGRFVYVSRSDVSSLAMNLRVHDVTRADLNFGTEMPIVRESKFVNDRIVFVGVPTDPRFRNTLRAYGTNQTFLTVTFSDGVERIQRTLELKPGRDVFEPAYAAIGNFPAFANGKTEMTVTVDPPFLSDTNPVAPVPVWAFVSVTNNETQVITTITPQP